MSEFLTTLPWGWYAGGLALAVVFVYGAAYYEAVKAPAEYHAYCARVDREITRHEALVEARLQAIDKRALLEDIEVAGLDALWELPVYRKRETA